jgi:hypothetical protein
VPAFIVGRRFDVLVANRIAAALVADFAAMPPRERNLARHVFLHPAARDVYVDWESVAHDTVGVLRRAAAQYPDDEQLEALVGELSVKSAEFARWWAKADIHEKQALLTYVAEPGSKSATALTLLGQLAADTDAGAATRAARAT